MLNILEEFLQRVSFKYVLDICCCLKTGQLTQDMFY